MASPHGHEMTQMRCTDDISVAAGEPWSQVSVYQQCESSNMLSLPVSHKFKLQNTLTWMQDRVLALFDLPSSRASARMVIEEIPTLKTRLFVCLLRQSCPDDAIFGVQCIRWSIKVWWCCAAVFESDVPHEEWYLRLPADFEIDVHHVFLNFYSNSPREHSAELSRRLIIPIEGPLYTLLFNIRNE